MSTELLCKIDAHWRAANYLSVGQIYLYDNPLLKRSLTLTHVKQMLLGHWGTTPGQNFNDSRSASLRFTPSLVPGGRHSEASLSASAPLPRCCSRCSPLENAQS